MSELATIARSDLITIHTDALQGSDEWHELRSGKFTSSKANTIATAGKGLLTYVSEILEPHVCGHISARFQGSSDTQRGNILEPIARTMYTFETGRMVREVAFVQAGDFIGVSPDGLVGNDGLVEIKCRNNAKHIAIALLGEPSKETYMQMQMQMLVTGRQWCDFIAYNPYVMGKPLIVQRILPDEKAFAKLLNGLEKGIAMLERGWELFNTETELIDIDLPIDEAAF